MANDCYFDLHVTCKNLEGILAILDGLGVEGFSNRENMFGDISAAWDYDKGHHKTKANGYGDYYAYVDGDCKWSVQSAILDKGKLQAIIKKYKLDVEIYSEEPGIGFMEHYMWEYGEMTLDETADFLLWHIDDLVDEEDLEIFLANDLVGRAKITKENYLSFADDDGYIKIGGYDYIWTIN